MVACIELAFSYIIFSNAGTKVSGKFLGKSGQLTHTIVHILPGAFHINIGHVKEKV